MMSLRVYIIMSTLTHHYVNLALHDFPNMSSLHVESCGKIIAASPKLEDMLGYPEHYLTSTNILDYVCDVHLNELRNALLSGQKWQQEIKITNRQGNGIYVMAFVSPLDDRRYRVILVDVNDYKLSLFKEMYLSTHDCLTDLGNRRLLNDRFLEIFRSHHWNQHIHALLSIDVNEFKAINDTFGHESGNKALSHIGEVTNSACQNSQNMYGFRVGGDEFIILKSTPIQAGHPESTIEEVAASLGKLVRNMRFTLTPDEHVIEVSVSAGILFFTTPSIKASAPPSHDQINQYKSMLLSQLDKELYRSKRQKQQHKVFTSFDIMLPKSCF